jgi:hypothetical protein
MDTSDLDDLITCFADAATSSCADHEWELAEFFADNMQ